MKKVHVRSAVFNTIFSNASFDRDPEEVSAKISKGGCRLWGRMNELRIEPQLKGPLPFQVTHRPPAL